MQPRQRKAKSRDTLLTTPTEHPGAAVPKALSGLKTSQENEPVNSSLFFFLLKPILTGFLLLLIK